MALKGHAKRGGNSGCEEGKQGKGHKKPALRVVKRVFGGALTGIRTPNLLIRSQVLYPIKL